MATAYDTWKTTEPDEDARDEAISKRRDELVAQWRTDDGKVREAIADALSDDCDDVFAGVLARLFTRIDAVDPASPRGDAHMADAACSAWRDLSPYVDGYLRDQAEGQAATEYDRAADMRAQVRAAA